MDERKTSRSRRRASRILAEKRRKGPPVSCDDESPTRERAKPPRRKKKEPLYEEDIIEGFAILSYIKYDDIEVSLNGGKAPKKKGNANNSSTNNSTNGVVIAEPKVPEVAIKQEEPLAPPVTVKINHVDKTNQDPSTSDDSLREKEKIKREVVAVIKRDPESEDNRVSDASSRCSSGQGYLCDSEDDDKNSDSGSVLFSASPPAVRKLDVPNEVVNGHGGGGERVPGAGVGVGVAVKSNGSPRPPSPDAPPPPLTLAMPPQQLHPPPKPSPNHFSPVSIPNGVTKVERVSPPPAGIVSAHSTHHRVAPPPAPPPVPVAYSLPSRPGYPPGYPHPQPPLAHSLPGHSLQGHSLPGHSLSGHALPGHSLPGHSLPGHSLPGHSQPPHPHPQPSPTACAPTPPSAPAPPPVSAYHPPLYTPYNNTPYLPPTSLHQPSRSPMGLKPITTSVGLVVTTATTTTSHRDTINAPLIGRTHSPRGHSPTRERDSYSSNVSSLSRGSMGTPSSMPPYSTSHHPSVVSSVASVVAPAAQPSSLPYKQPSPWVSSTNPPQPTAPGRTGLTPHHHPFAPPMFPPNQVPAPPVSSAPAPPPAPNPFSAESLFQSSKSTPVVGLPSDQGDLLRRELDSRFLATQDRGPYIRTEMHHHQHQHTHVHQHTTPIIPPPPPTLFSSPMVNFKEMPKGNPVDSPFYRQSLGFSGYPGYTPSLIHPSFGPTTPFAPPSHLPTFTPKQLTEPSKPKTVKTGKWNAMHVRVAWEIYHHQQKSGGGEGKVGPLIGKSDFMRPPTHMFGPPPPPHPFTAPSHRTVPQAYDPTPSHTFPPSMGSSVFGRYPPTGPTFPTALPSFPHAPAIHDPWGRIQPRGVPPQGFPPPSPWGLKPEVMDEREREKERERSRERERQRREEKQRQRMVGVPSKVRDRSPLREPPPQAHPMLPASTVSKEEEAAMISRTQHYLAARQAPRPLPPHFPHQSPWDPYRYDPLRYNPLMAALQEEEQRVKLFGYGGAPPPSLAHLRSKAPSPSHRLPPAPHGAHPKDDPNQPR